MTSPALGSLVSGVSSVAFIGHDLYALLAGAGCSHGVPHVPNGVIHVMPNGTWKTIANLSAFQKAHPVANPDDEDFEPDGTWYSMIALNGALYPMDSNHGELDRVTPHGAISRVADISAKVGHVVPTALIHRRGGGRHAPPQFLIGNLGVFGPPDGTVKNEHVYRLNGEPAAQGARVPPRAGGRPRRPARPALRARAERNARGARPPVRARSCAWWATARHPRRSSPG